MSTKPLISIIVPVYNIMEYLPRCVHSLTAQTYGSLEILLVDDGSTDGTARLCDRLAAEDYRIRVYHKKNGGTSSARNVGLQLAQGEYIGFVDSDDYIEPEMYELLMGAIERYQVKAAQIGRDEIDEQGQRMPNVCEPPSEPEVIESRDFLRELLMHRGDCSFCTKLIHREMFSEYNFPEGALNEDFYLLVKQLPGLERIASLPQQTYHVFYRVGSNTRKESKENFSRVFCDIVDNADMVTEIVRRDYPELEKEAVRFGIFQRLDYMLHIPVSQMTRDNQRYRDITGWLRRSWFKGICNPYLTGKNKLYHTLFAVAPKGIRVLHRKLKRW